jgi:hypothetical protein
MAVIATKIAEPVAVEDDLTAQLNGDLGVRRRAPGRRSTSSAPTQARESVAPALKLREDKLRPSGTPNAQRSRELELRAYAPGRSLARAMADADLIA